MTATPITENPMEFVKLINLCKPLEQQIPDDFSVFADQYLDTDGVFTDSGRTKFLDNIAGNFSYLNREKDARQFAQPRIEYISVPLVQEPNSVLKMDKRFVRSMFNEPIDELKRRVIKESEQIDGDLKEIDSGMFYKLRDQCKPYDERDPKLGKKCVKYVNEYIRDAVKDARGLVKEIRDKMKEIRKELKLKRGERKELMKEIKDTKIDAGQMESFKNSPYYMLRYKCGKKYTDNTHFEKILKHVSVVSGYPILNSKPSNIVSDMPSQKFLKTSKNSKNYLKSLEYLRKYNLDLCFDLYYYALERCVDLDEL
jgi:hypothetical protein